MSCFADLDLEVLSEEHGFVCYTGRRRGDPSPVLVIAPLARDPAPEIPRRLEYEYEFAKTLDPSWALVSRALIQRDGRVMLILDYPPGDRLDRLLRRPLALTQALRIAIGLAGALARLHARGFVHKDLKPTHVFADPATGEVRMTGFGIASSVPRERQAPEPPEIIAGTLTYMAPEQTGRMNRSVDLRSDLYSFGVILYEMLTGELPFAADDAIGWVHCHVARRVVPPTHHAADLPEPVSAIVMKLLAKNAEERYQSAAGVMADLTRCLAAWQARGAIDPFALGILDRSDRLLIPEKLYGRERELALLGEMLDRVIASGTPELVLVSGGSGIGKSALVGELHKALVRAHGFFAAGTFDPPKRDSPYASLAQAFRPLIRQILSRSEAEIGLWRPAFRDALGANGQIIVNLVPELELLIGRPAPLPALSPRDAQSLFHIVFRRFVAVFARPEHPLVLFLDDLQWADAPTLALLEEVIGAADAGHLLLIGAYRDGEVAPAHPLAAALGRLREAGASMHEYALAPLAPDDVNRLVAETLHCDGEQARPLSELLYEKTGGNPFFVIQFFTELAEEALVVFDPSSAAWQWDLARIRAKGFTDNVVDLMVVKLSRLPEETRTILSQLACLGDDAPAPVLARIRGSTEETVHAELWGAVRAGLVGRQDDVYAFLHDRIRETAYSLIPQGEQAALHLLIGRQLWSERAAAELGEEIYAIVGQYNHALALVASTAERLRLAELYLLAGRRAKGAAAYDAASAYLAVGSSLLPDEPWEDHYDLAFGLEFHRAESEFLSGAVAAAEARLAALSGRIRTLVDRAAAACLSMSLHLTRDRPDRAIEACLAYLAQVGIGWSPRPSDEDVRREFEEMWQRIGSRPIAALADLPLMTDPECRATMDVLTAGQPAAAFTDENLHGLLVARMANLSLEHGNIDGSCLAYVWLGMILGPRFGDYRAGFSLARLGIDLIERRGLHRYDARAYLGFGHIVSPWTQPLRSGCALVRRAFDVAVGTGDLTYAAFSRHALVALLLDAGEPLGEIERETEQALLFLKRMKFGLTVDMLTPLRQLVRALRGLTNSLSCFDDAGFDEQAYEQHLANDRHLAIAACWYWIRKLQLRVFAGDYEVACDAAARAEQLLWTSPWFHERAVYHFYAAVAHAADGDAAAALVHHRHLENWAATGSGNFESYALLTAAELARLQDRDIEAMRLYDQAIEAARANGFVQNAALAHELAARFYRQRSFATIAETYERKARDLYDRWGALGKVQALDRLHPHQREAAATARPRATIGAPVTQLDVAAVVKTAQALSGEILLGRLIETLMRIALEHAGAERGFLLLLRGTALQIEAEAATGSGGIEVTLRQAEIGEAELAESVVHYVMRMRESVILDDASRPNLFSEDADLARRRLRSVLCVPLIKQGRLIGLLYLENNAAPGIFTPERASVLDVLAAQAAISLENARLYADLETENHERRRAEAALRHSEERFRDYAETASDWFWETGPDHRFTYISQRIAALGFSPTKVIGKLRWEVAADVEAEPEKWRRIGALEARHEPFRAFTYKAMSRDGLPRYVAVSGKPLFDASGRFLGYRGVGSDVTAAVHADEALREAKDQQLLHQAQKLAADAERLELLGRLVDVQEQERRRIARELHDQMSQDLIGLSLGMKKLEASVGDDGAREALRGLQAQTAQIGGNVHRFAWELRPTSLDDIGLVRALETYVADWSERFGVQVDFHARDAEEIRAPPMVETTAYRLVQEALTNVVKHARASTVSLVLESKHDQLQIVVEDNGTGLETEAAMTKGRLGLAGMRERLALVGGSMTIESTNGVGTTLYFRLPLAPTGAAASGTL